MCWKMLGELVGWRKRKKQRESRDWTQHPCCWAAFLSVHFHHCLGKTHPPDPLIHRLLAEGWDTAVRGYILSSSSTEKDLEEDADGPSLGPALTSGSHCPSLECALIPGGWAVSCQAEAKCETEERMTWGHGRWSETIATTHLAHQKCWGLRVWAGGAQWVISLKNWFHIKKK